MTDISHESVCACWSPVQQASTGLLSVQEGHQECSQTMRSPGFCWSRGHLGLLWLTGLARERKKPVSPHMLHLKTWTRNSCVLEHLPFHPCVLTSTIFVSSPVSLTLFRPLFCGRRQKFPSQAQGCIISTQGSLCQELC